jgi:uncharacterized cupin superfamily protein
MFSITQYGKELGKSKYSWNEETKTLSTKENYLVLDFSDYDEVTFKTGHSCTFKTGEDCTFKTGESCTFKTGSCCTFKTGDYCTFHTGHSCTFHTGYYCTFKTGDSCTFDTDSDCTFTIGHSCTFKTGDNCVAIRYDVKGINEIPKDITITFNGYCIPGYTEVKEDKPNPCNGKVVVEIDGKKYKLQEIS